MSLRDRLQSSLETFMPSGRDFLSPLDLRGISKNGETDPIQYYKMPVVGWLFRERINRGLRLLPERRFDRALEVGYAAGVVIQALAPSVEDLHGIDLDADPAPVLARLGALGITANLRQGTVYDLPYESGSFDLVACFSVIEHLDRYPRALDEVHRVLKPGGLFLLGMPSVNKTMTVAFHAIGFHTIDDHHVTTPAQVSARFGATGFSIEREAHLDMPSAPPAGLRLYYNWLLKKID